MKIRGIIWGSPIFSFKFFYLDFTIFPFLTFSCRSLYIGQKNPLLSFKAWWKYQRKIYFQLFLVRALFCHCDESRCKERKTSHWWRWRSISDQPSVQPIKTLANKVVYTYIANPYRYTYLCVHWHENTYI